MYDRLIPPERIHPWGDEDLLEATEQDRTRIVQAALQPVQQPRMVLGIQGLEIGWRGRGGQHADRMGWDGIS